MKNYTITSSQSILNIVVILSFRRNERDCRCTRRSQPRRSRPSLRRVRPHRFVESLICLRPWECCSRLPLARDPTDKKKRATHFRSLRNRNLKIHSSAQARLFPLINSAPRFRIDAISRHIEAQFGSGRVKWGLY